MKTQKKIEKKLIVSMDVQLYTRMCNIHIHPDMLCIYSNRYHHTPNNFRDSGLRLGSWNLEQSIVVGNQQSLNFQTDTSQTEQHT